MPRDALLGCLGKPPSWLGTEDMHMKAPHGEGQAVSGHGRHVSGAPYPIPAQRMIPTLPSGTHPVPASPQSV